MATHHDDDSTMPEETQGYKLSQPKQSLAEYQQMGTLMCLFNPLAFFWGGTLGRPFLCPDVKSKQVLCLSRQLHNNHS